MISTTTFTTIARLCSPKNVGPRYGNKGGSYLGSYQARMGTGSAAALLLRHLYAAASGNLEEPIMYLCFAGA